MLVNWDQHKRRMDTPLQIQNESYGKKLAINKRLQSCLHTEDVAHRFVQIAAARILHCIPVTQCITPFICAYLVIKCRVILLELEDELWKRGRSFTAYHISNLWDVLDCDR